MKRREERRVEVEVEEVKEQELSSSGFFAAPASSRVMKRRLRRKVTGAASASARIIQPRPRTQ